MSTLWERVPLDEAVFMQEGPGIRSYEYQKGGYPMINVRCVQDGYIDLSTCNAANVELANGKWKHFQVDESDILFTISGSIGRTAKVKKEHLPLLMNTSVVRFRPKTPRLKDDFLFYYLQSWNFLARLYAMASGTAQKNVGPTHLKTMDVPLPPLPEQQRIVGILDKAFEGIATAKANAEQNLQNTRALFESYLQSVFTQGGPGWVVKKVGEIANHSLGKMLDKAKNKGELKPYLRNLNVRWFIFDLSDLLQMPFLPSEAEKYTAVKGDVLICEGGYPGRAAIWQEDYPIYFQKALHRVRFHEPEHSGWFVYYLYSQDTSGTLRQHFSGTGIQHFTGEVLARFEVPLPPLSELRSAVATFEELSEETQRLETIYNQKLVALEALKRSVLHQAFTGKL